MKIIKKNIRQDITKLLQKNIINLDCNIQFLFHLNCVWIFLGLFIDSSSSKSTKTQRDQLPSSTKKISKKYLTTNTQECQTEIQKKPPTTYVFKQGSQQLQK